MKKYNNELIFSGEENIGNKTLQIALVDFRPRYILISGEWEHIFPNFNELHHYLNNKPSKCVAVFHKGDTDIEFKDMTCTEAFLRYEYDNKD